MRPEPVIVRAGDGIRATGPTFAVQEWRHGRWQFEQRVSRQP